jgi:DNA replication protein DnaC
VAKDLGRRYSHERIGDLARYQVYHVDQHATVERLRGLLGDFPTMVKEGRGLLFYGMVGTGKDHLLACALYHAAAIGTDCRWVNGQEVYGQFRDRMDTGQREEELFAKFFKPTVLAISDPIPPVGDPSAWNVAQLYRLLDRRYREMKSTWVSLNAVSLEDADAKLSSPVFDRLQECCELFPCFWPSFRERKQKRSAS